MKEIMFKAKLKNWKTNPQQNKWVEGYYLSRKETAYCFIEDYETNPVKTLHYIAVDTITDWGLPNKFKLYEIDPDTLCQFTNLTDWHKNKIWENDIVEVVSHSKKPDKFLIWWNREMNLMDAVPLTDGVEFNGVDYYNHKHYFKENYKAFSSMTVDPWGIFTDVKVIGNNIDRKEV